MSSAPRLRADVRGIQILGPCCSGKSTLAERIGQELGLVLLEGDAFHSRANVEAIRAGEALTDEMRLRGWIPAMAEALAAHVAAGIPVVLAWSGLRRMYRDRIVIPGVRRFWLHLPQGHAFQRAQTRHGHFASPNVVHTNYQIVESPGREEPDIVVLPAIHPVAFLAATIKNNVLPLSYLEA